MAKRGVVFHKGAFAEVRTLPAVMDELDSIAEGIAARAGDGFKAEPAEATGGRIRGRAAVVTATPKAMVAEARNHVLERSL